MESDPDTRLDLVIQLSEEMLEAALAADWDGVTAQQDHRDGLIHDVFGSLVDPSAQGVREKLWRIRELDRQLLALGQRRRAELQEERRKLSQARKAVRHYLG